MATAAKKPASKPAAKPAAKPSPRHVPVGSGIANKGRETVMSRRRSIDDAVDKMSR
jgi:hypothetical protein